LSIKGFRPDLIVAVKRSIFSFSLMDDE
jgi:hypothetical protein